MYPVRELPFVRILIILFTLGLTACGGSGDSTSTPTTPTPAPAPTPTPTPTPFTLVDQGLNSGVTTVAEATDGTGDIYVGGYLTNYNDTTINYITRFNSDATVDTGFATGTGFDDSVSSVVPLTDGSGDIYVGGWFNSYNGTASNRIIRLNSDGSVDTAFAVGTGFSSGVSAIALATDGSGDIYVGGWFASYKGTTSNRIIRLNSDGSIDTAFDVGTGLNMGPRTIAIANDGSGDIYVGGIFTSYNGTTSNRIIRLNNDGSIDTTFAVGTGFNSDVTAIVPANDVSGDIYVGGWFSSYNGAATARIIRLNSNGTEDTGFAVGTGFDTSVYTLALAADASGDIYVGGGFTSYKGTASNRIIRLNSNGTVDTAFAVGTGFDSSVYVVTPITGSSGDLYVGGYFTSYKGSVGSFLTRLNSDASRDSAFTLNTVTAFDSDVFTLAVADDGSGDIYAGGAFLSYNGTSSIRMVRLNNDGTVDSGFDVGAGFDDDVNTIALAADGSGDIYVGGSFSSYKGTSSNGIIRLNSDGSIDSGFAVGTGTSTVRSIVPVGDGSGDIYVGGWFTSYNGTASNRIIRLNSDGSVDTAFAVGTGFNNGVSAIALANDGSGDIYVGGYFTSYNGTASNYITRLNSNGTIDTAFVVGTGFNNAVATIALAGDGSGDIYVGGYFTSYDGTASNNITRLNSDGTIDTAFATGTGFDFEVLTITTASDSSGDIYVGGVFTSYNGATSNFVTRLNSDGSVDTGFVSGAGFTGSTVESIVSSVDGSGCIYVGGYFRSYQGVAVLNVVSLTQDGGIN